MLYPFKWSHEDEDPQTHGRKPRETVLVARFMFEGHDEIALLPISASPRREDNAFELPEIDVRRIARGGKTRLYVVLREINFDRIGESWHLEPNAKVGEFSPLTMKQLWNRFSEALATARKIKRYE